MKTWSGTVSGSWSSHSPQTLEATLRNAFLALPGGWEGTLAEAPAAPGRHPVMIFMHGSSGINEAAKIFGRRLAERGIAFLAPNGMATPGRLAYTSPVSPEIYEKVHAMRSAELDRALEALPCLSFFDGRFVIAGTSEGGVAAARHAVRPDLSEAGRLILSWSCEDNYHVEQHRTAIPLDMPVLNVMSAEDKYFSRANAYLGIMPRSCSSPGRRIRSTTSPKPSRTSRPSSSTCSPEALRALESALRHPARMRRAACARALR